MGGATATSSSPRNNYEGFRTHRYFFSPGGPSLCCMRYTTAVLAVLFCLCAAIVMVTALTPTPVAADGAKENERVIRTSAVGEVVSSPDRAEIQVGVETENTDVRAAQSQNAERMTRVTNAIKALGIPADHLTTTGYTVYPVYDDGATPVPLEGRKVRVYRVSNTLLVRIDDVARVGDVIDTAVSSDANQVNSIAFLFSEGKATELRAEALKQAVNRTRTDASSVASALGVSIIGPREVQVDSGPTPIVYERASGAMDAAAPKTPIEPGSLKVTANVQVAWAYA
ncbi:hypothetical protein DSECCO2_384470 [anaerobic digester metagenome]